MDDNVASRDGSADDVVMYAAGSGTALISTRSVVLLGPEVAGSTALGLWAGVKASNSMHELVDAVMAIGLRNVPTVGIAYWDEDAVRLLLRGTVRAFVPAADGSEEAVSAEHAATWLERTVNGPIGIFLADEEAGELLPIVEGMVAAVSVFVSWSEVPSGHASAGISADTTGGDLQSAGEWVPVEPVHRARPDPDVHSTLSVADFSGVPEGTAAENDAGTNPAEQNTGDRPNDAAVAAVTPVENPGSEPADDFEDLFGATRLPQPVERAAVRQVEGAEGVGGPNAATGAEAPAPTASDPVPRPEPVSGQPGGEERPSPLSFAPPRPRGSLGAPVPPPPGGSSKLIDGVPGIGNSRAGSHRHDEMGRSGSEGEPTVAVSSSESGSVAGHPPGGGLGPSSGVEEDLGNLTVTRAQLNKLKAPTTEAANSTGGSVHGVWCQSGHPNPPSATTCRICGLGLGDANPVSMPRPLLGRLLFSNGTEVQLDRPVIVGRLPKAERISARELPQLVTVPSPDKDISRNHLEVRIDGWHVLVVDLGSTNGTVVTTPGQPPERLRAGEEQPIVPGTVVTIADEVTFVYEAIG